MSYTGYYRFLNPAINLRDADLIKNVLIKDHFNFHANDQNYSKKFDPLMQFNPFVASNDSWRKARNILTPTLTLSKVIKYHTRKVNLHLFFGVCTLYGSLVYIVAFDELKRKKVKEWQPWKSAQKRCVQTTI